MPKMPRKIKKSKSKKPGSEKRKRSRSKSAASESSVEEEINDEMVKMRVPVEILNDN